MRRHSRSIIPAAGLVVAAVAVLVVGPRLFGSTADSTAEARPRTVTLSASRSAVTFGRSVALRGTVSVPASQASVSVVDDTGAVVAEAEADESGSFEARFEPQRRTTLVARWAGASSDPVTVGVRARALVTLVAIELDGAAITGRVRPAVDDASAEVVLRRDGRPIAQDAVSPDTRGDFSVTLETDGPGRYVASLTYEAPGVRSRTVRSSSLRLSAPPIVAGATGPAVRNLEEQLSALGYYLPTVDDTFDEATADAIRAFTKVQGLERVGTATDAVWRALEDPKSPRARVREPGYHVEVDQTKQVMYTVEDGSITNIVHVSTGASGATLDGTFTIYKKGGVGREYYPSYFDGRRAFHIWPDVPTYPASHGCVRLPFWTAEWYWDHTPIGTEVVIYH